MLLNRLVQIKSFSLEDAPLTFTEPSSCSKASGSFQTSLSVHTLLLGNLTGSVEYDRGPWPYLVCGPQSPRHSASGGVLWHFWGTALALKNATLPLLVHGRLFVGLEHYSARANYVTGGRSLIPNSDTPELCTERPKGNAWRCPPVD